MALTFKESLAYFWQQIAAQFVRKENGKGLSTNDFTDAEKEKLAAAVLSVDGVKPDENGNIVSEKKVLEPQNSIRLIDEVNGYIYTLAMRNGELITYLSTDRIEVIQMPNKTTYMEGESFDTAGMVVMAYRPDGSSKDITNTITVNPVSFGDTAATITYNEGGITFTTTINITVQPFDPAIVLVDFNYTDNGNDTYTITGWKGTTNGVAGTEIIIPNSGKIIL